MEKETGKRGRTAGQQTLLPSGEVRRNWKWFVEPLSTHQPVGVHGSLHLQQQPVQFCVFCSMRSTCEGTWAFLVSMW